MLFLGDEYSFAFRYPHFLSIILPAYGFAIFIGFLISFREARARIAKSIHGILWVCARWILVFPLFIVMLILALAGLERFKTNILGEELQGRVALAIDDSPSQGATDIPSELAAAFRSRGRLPTRLVACTETLREAFQNVRGLEVILFTFTEATKLRSGDWIKLGNTKVIDGILEGIEPSWVGSGTNLARIFEEAREELGTEPDFFIVCSDGGKGGTYNAEPSEVIKKVKSFSSQRPRGVPVYVLGVGKIGGSSTIPLFSTDGKAIGHLRNPASGQEVLTEFDEDILAAIGLAGGGRYLFISDLSVGKRILSYAALSSLKRGGGVRVRSAEDWSGIFIFPSLMLLVFVAEGHLWLKTFFRKIIT